jgi:hypothetical protein
LSQAEFREETKNIRELLSLANTQETNTLNALKLTCTMLENATDAREQKYHKKRKLDLLERLEELDARKRRLEEESDHLRDEAARKRQNRPPNQVSILDCEADNRTMHSSLSHSGLSSKKKKAPTKRSPELVVLLGSNGDDDDEEEDKEDNYMADSGKLAQSPMFNSPIPDAPAPINKKRIMSKTEQELDPASKSVLEQYRAKYPNPAEGYHRNYGMDYPY